MAIQDPVSERKSDIDEKIEIQHSERAIDNGIISPEEIQGRFDLLRDLNSAQMAALNKKVLRKVD
jgi:hypothetical protein